MNLPEQYDAKVIAKIIQDLLTRIKQLEAIINQLRGTP